MLLTANGSQWLLNNTSFGLQPSKMFHCLFLAKFVSFKCFLGPSFPSSCKVLTFWYQTFVQAYQLCLHTYLHPRCQARPTTKKPRFLIQLKYMQSQKPHKKYTPIPPEGATTSQKLDGSVQVKLKPYTFSQSNAIYIEPYLRLYLPNLLLVKCSEEKFSSKINFILSASVSLQCEQEKKRRKKKMTVFILNEEFILAHV